MRIAECGVVTVVIVIVVSLTVVIGGGDGRNDCSRHVRPPHTPRRLVVQLAT